MKNEIALLIQGPYEGSNYSKIFGNLKKLPRDIWQNIHIVIVCYAADRKKINEELTKYNLKECVCEVIFVKDLINPGYFNINRQIRCMMAGLSALKGNPCVIKLRNDQCVDFKKIMKKLREVDYFNEGDRQLLTTNCYTRPDRKYHPSDMFLCGRKNELLKYYDMDLNEETHMDKVLETIEYYEKTKEDMFFFFESPENMLYQNYLKHKGWNLLNTKEDSFLAINKYCYVINSWDIGLTWEKKRTPLLPKGSIILPYSIVEVPPFPGLPAEKVCCYSRHDFEGNITLKDKYYLFLGKICFLYGYGTGFLSKAFFRNMFVKMARCLPLSFRQALKGTKVYVWYRGWFSPL